MEKMEQQREILENKIIENQNEITKIQSQNEVVELTIVTKRDKVCFIKIIDRVVIEEFKEIILNYTFIPKKRTGQFNRFSDLTIITNEGFYTINVSSDPYNPVIRSDSVEISFFKKHNFNVYYSYKKCEREGISLNEIARKVGVSKRMIQKYESGESEVSVNKALRLYRIFGHGVFDKINIFDRKKELI